MNQHHWTLCILFNNRRTFHADELCTHQVLQSTVSVSPGWYTCPLCMHGQLVSFMQPPAPSDSRPSGHMQPDVQPVLICDQIRRGVRWTCRVLRVIKTILAVVLTQSMSTVLQLFWHSVPVVPGLAVEQSKYVMGATHDREAGGQHNTFNVSNQNERFQIGKNDDLEGD